jgi:hypothetical protein
LLFEAFRIPYSPAIGVKLIATPWTDEHLGQVEGINADIHLRRISLPSRREAPWFFQGVFLMDTQVLRA